MPCHEWRSLLEQYRRAVQTYSKAAQELNPASDDAFNGSWERAERARNNAESARAGLLSHEHQHGCAVLESGNQLLAVNTDDLVLGDQGQSGG